MKKKILEKLVTPLLITAFLGINVAGAYLTNKEIENNGGKTMPGVQPWRWVYDDNGDCIADRTQVGIVGGPLGQWRVLYEREPTQEEKEWYKNN